MVTPVQIDHTFDEELHEYRDDRNCVVPSTTQVMQNVGFYDELFRANPDDVEKKRIIGKVVHKATQLIEQNKLDWASVDTNAGGYLDAYGAFLQDTGFKTRFVERRIVVKIHGMPVGMTIDREGWIKHKSVWRLAIGELKCTAQDEEYWGIQTASYDMGMGEPQEIEGKPVEITQARKDWKDHNKMRLRFAVQLKPSGKYKLHIYEDPAHYALFVSALSLTWWKINHLKKYRNGFVRG